MTCVMECCDDSGYPGHAVRRRRRHCRRCRTCRITTSLRSAS